MLPAARRLRDRHGFTTVVRQGRRASAGRLVGYWDPSPTAAPEPVVGLIVSRAVGGAVERNRVKRRLRHHLRAPLVQLPGVVVVRALPGAAEVSSTRFGRDVERLCRRLAEATAR